MLLFMSFVFIFPSFHIDSGKSLKRIESHTKWSYAYTNARSTPIHIMWQRDQWKIVRKSRLHENDRTHEGHRTEHISCLVFEENLSDFVPTQFTQHTHAQSKWFFRQKKTIFPWFLRKLENIDHFLVVPLFTARMRIRLVNSFKCVIWNASHCLFFHIRSHKYIYADKCNSQKQTHHWLTDHFGARVTNFQFISTDIFLSLTSI